MSVPDSSVPVPPTSGAVVAGPAPVGLSISTLIALVVAGLGVGFAAFTYAVPYSRMLKEQKLMRGQLMAVQADASGRQRELDQLRKDRSAHDSSSDELVRARSEMSIMGAAVQEIARALPPDAVTVSAGTRTLVVRFSESALFHARGPTFTRDGQAALENVAAVVGGKAARVLITAPMGEAKLARWVAENYLHPADLAASRVRSVVRVLQQTIDPPDVVWGVASGGPSGTGEAAVEIEIEPRG